MAASMVICMICISNVTAQDPDAMLFRDDFNDLSNWRPLYFPKIDRHTDYKIDADGTNNVLVAKSDASASGLVYTNSFDVGKYRMLKWCWKTENVYEKGNAKKKACDDYPIRLYIIFEYDPEIAGLALRAKYGLAKTIYGE